MKIRIFMLVIAVVGVLIGCDEDGGTVPQPQIPGYIWEVWTWQSDSDPYQPPLTWASKYYADDGNYPPYDDRWDDPRYFYGGGDDAAYGDGRLWIAGEGSLSVDYDDPKSGIFEVGVGLFDTVNVEGLTYDGEHLWGSSDSDFYRIDPDTYEHEFMFTYGDGSLRFKGLAWDGEYLWGLASGEAIKIDPETGSGFHTVTCPYGVGLAWGAKYLWVNDRDGIIYRFSPVDGSVLQTLYTNKGGFYTPGGLAYEPPE